MVNSKQETLLLAALALGATGVFGLLATREYVEEESPDEQSRSLVVPPAPAPSMNVRSLSEGLFDHGHWRGKSQLADLNKDGLADIVTSIRRWEPGKLGEGLYVWLGDGEGQWTLAIDGIPREMGYGGSDLGDVNGDGHLDIAFSGHDVFPQVFLGDSSGKWTAASEGIATEGVCSDVALGDLDGDGRDELATMGFFPRSGGLYAFEFGEDGVWNFTDELVEKAVFGSEVEMLDLDSDGIDEIVATTEIGPRIFRKTAEGFEDWSQGLPTPEIGGSDLGLDAYDLDGDGDLELLVSGMIYDGHPPLRLYDWNGEEWVDWGTGMPDDEAVFDAVFAQIDGEGLPEIVAAGKHGISIISITGLRQIERTGRIDGTQGVVNTACGDVTGDGRDEILYVGFQGVRVLQVIQTESGTS